MKLLTRCIVPALFAVFIMWALSLQGNPLDYSGTYRGIDSPDKKHCGRSLIMKKLRTNRYEMKWRLRKGDVFVFELDGQIKGNTLDFRKGPYGYVYTFTENGSILKVSLITPEGEKFCMFKKRK